MLIKAGVQHTGSIHCQHCDCHHCPARRTNLFCKLNEIEVEKINQTKTCHAYKKKQIIHLQGHPSFGVYCIQSGWVKVYRTSNDGKQYIMRLAGKGDSLGLPTLFDNKTYLWTAEVLEDTVACFLKHQVVLEILQSNPQTTFHLVKYLARRLNETEEERAEMAQHSVRERMARLLLMQSEKYGTPGSHGTSIKLHLSREEMAEMIGTAMETTIRFLKEFREDKMIALNGKNITVLDHQRLMETAHMV